MSVNDFKRVESVFEAALAVDEDKREAHVRQMCGDDEALCARVLRMLGHATREFVCDDLQQAMESSTESRADDLIGVRIGKYLLEERIGEGGFGAVYRAKQLEPVTRTVALKVIKLGMDTEKVIARFEAERQALAMMDHPHIARVFDAGATETGRPYFVMELVHGLPMTRFCDEHELPVHARLRLFILVCQALQHAHQKGVIHRDVKPSNVLVRFEDGQPVPKVIDFGIAKATQGRLTDRTLQTEHRAFVGTPAYMSPEQAGADVAHIDTRTDIYSLGVLLYELLVGVTPFEPPPGRASNPEEILRQVREQDPKKPSTRLSMLGARSEEIARQRGEETASLQRQLQGDLDWIVLKAMEKEPDRRYESAAELAHEIERYLHSEPITARPPGPLYLASKFVRRNQVAVTATAVIVMTLLVGLIVSVVGLNEAREAHWQAEEALELAQYRLLESLHAQAGAARNSDQIGRRFQALGAIATAAQIVPSAALLDDAIAATALQDFEIVREFPPLRRPTARGLRTIDRFAHVTGPGEVVIEWTDIRRDAIQLTTVPRRIWFMEFSDDGRYIAAKLHDRSNEMYVTVWDIETGNAVLTLSDLRARHNLTLTRIDGRHVLVIVADDELRIYGLPDGATLHMLRLPFRSRWIVGDPATGRLAVSHFDDKAVSIWSLRDAEQQILFETPTAIRDMAWHPDGRRLAGCGGDYRMHVWDSRTGAEVAVLTGHEGAPVEVFFSNDGSVMATHGWDSTARLWNMRSGEPLFGPLLDTQIVGLADAMLTADAEHVRLWRYEPALECQRFQCNDSFGPDPELRFSPSGTLLLSAGWNGVRLWETASLREIAAITEDRAMFADFSADGTSIIAATADQILQWPLEQEDANGRVGQPRLLLERSGIRGCSLDRDEGRLAVLTAATIEIINLQSMATLLSIPAFAETSRIPRLDPSGRWVFIGNWRGEAARLIDVETGEVVCEFSGLHVICDFSPDGRYMILSTAESLETFTTDPWRSVDRRRRVNWSDLAGMISFSGGRNIAAAMHSRFDVHLLDVESGELLTRLSAPRPAALAALAVSDDGTKVAAASAGGLLILWDLDRIGRRLRELGLDWPAERILNP